MKIQSEIQRLVTIRQASITLGISTQHVHRLIVDGMLPAVRTPLGYLIDPDDVEQLRQEREARSAA